MAFRLVSKIRSSIFPKFARSFTAKTETVACTTSQQQQQEQQKTESSDGSGEPPGNIQNFNVYTAPNLARTAENENMVRQQMENRQLQPSKLPDYYKSEIDIQHGTYPLVDTLEHSPAPSSLKQRRFEVSKTYANATLPLKMPKLASPFPDPVKIMSSHTTSDQEKAEQMLAEARIPKGTVEPAPEKAAPNRVYTRNYSKRGKTVDRDDEKCKKVGKKKSKCVKMVAPGCKKPKTITCDKKRKPIECKKVNAPYPSYSEACYEDVLEKPSECKLCPWRPKDNPHFKVPTKKKYHTKITNDENVVDKVAKEEDGGYLMDAKKKPCKNPSEKGKKKKKKGKKKDKKSKKKKDKKSKSKKKKKDHKGKKAAGWTTAVRRYGETKENEETEIVINCKMITAKGKKDKKKKRPCKKFPHDKCKKKKDKRKKSGGKDKCRKKKKPIIKGCLANDPWETIEITTETGQPLDLALAKRDKKKTKKHRKPKADKKKKRGPKTQDECEKKKPSTKECPADVFESVKGRRRRQKSKKKKWTSARAKPYMAKRKTEPYRISKKRKMQEKI